MPELPEVETICRGIKDKLIGKKILVVDVKVKKLFIGDINDIINAKIIGAKRLGKILIINLDNNYSIVIHLKMSGQLVYRDTKSKKTFAGGHSTKVYMQEPPHKYTHVTYSFSDGSHLYYNDYRKFGWNRIAKSNEVMKLLKLEKMGPEPNTSGFTIEYLNKIFLKSGKAIKLILMDQEKISGVGNIYANDGLYDAGILPTRPAKTLSKNEILRLKLSIEKVIKMGIKYGGSSENSYVDLEGNLGQYMDHSVVYRKKVDPKGHKLKRIKIGGRGSFICNKCQK